MTKGVNLCSNKAMGVIILGTNIIYILLAGCIARHKAPCLAALAWGVRGHAPPPPRQFFFKNGAIWCVLVYYFDQILSLTLWCLRVIQVDSPPPLLPPLLAVI